MTSCGHPLDGHTSHGPWCEEPQESQPPVPDEALDAAAGAVHVWAEDCDHTGALHAVNLDGDRECAQVALEAAAPLIRAAERERIRQLAVDHEAYYTRRLNTTDDAGLAIIQECDLPFADLIGDQ